MLTCLMAPGLDGVQVGWPRNRYMTRPGPGEFRSHIRLKCGYPGVEVLRMMTIDMVNLRM
jgi:hypothetical protein